MVGENLGNVNIIEQEKKKLFDRVRQEMLPVMDKEIRAWVVQKSPDDEEMEERARILAKANIQAIDSIEFIEHNDEEKFKWMLEKGYNIDDLRLERIYYDDNIKVYYSLVNGMEIGIELRFTQEYKMDKNTWMRYISIYNVYFNELKKLKEEDIRRRYEELKKQYEEIRREYEKIKRIYEQITGQSL